MEISHFIKKVSAILLCLTFLGCSSSLKKGINESEINAEAFRAYKEIKATSKISQNKEWTAIVNRVAKRIADASDENFQWEVMLIDSPEVNAWCMPGGKMAVYTGILPVVKTEGALAAVMGHEVAHATLRHGMERYARAKQNNYWGLIAAGASIIGGEILCKTDTCKKMAQLGGVAAGFAITFLDRKFSREDETEADRQGQLFMAKAGYAPSESIALWERMGATKKGMEPPEFISTHPSDARRREKLKGWLPEAQALYNQAPQQFGQGTTL